MKRINPYILVAPWIILALITGLLAGLSKLGWNFPVGDLTGIHGLIMVGGFLGTIICFEKTAPLENRRHLLFPIVSGLSVLFMVVGNITVALILQLVASLGLISAYFQWSKKTKEPYYQIMMIGSLAWLIATAGILAGRAVPLVIHWWMAFVLFTIVGERMELTRFLPLKKTNRSMLFIFLFLFLAGIFMPYHSYGKLVLGLALMLAGAWLLRFDIVRFSINKTGQHRYIAILLLVGYVWLLVSGILIMLGSTIPNQYGITVHTFFLGFTFSMIFAHGPIILPGLIKKNIKIYSRSLYLWITGFHLTLLMRIVSDIMGNAEILRYSGLLNAIFILIFFGNLMYNTRTALGKLNVETQSSS